MSTISWTTQLAWRYLRTKSRRGFISLSTWFSFLGIALGVGTLIVVMSVMNGFRQELLTKVLGMNGHLSLVSPLGEMPEKGSLDFCKSLKSNPSIKSISPIIDKQGLLMANGKASGAIVHGITWQGLKGKPITLERLGCQPDLFKGHGIVLGFRLAKNLGVAPGDILDLMVPEGSPTAFGDLPRSITLEVIDTFRSDMYDYDQAFAFIPLECAQDAYQMGEKIKSFEVMVQNPLQLDPVIQDLRTFAYYRSQALQVFDWRQANQSFFSAIQVQKNVMFLILSLIIFVASFSIISNLTMLVKEKNEAIAILKTMGASPRHVQSIFLKIGIWIGSAGIFVGSLLGLGFAYHIDTLRRFLESHLGRDLFSPEVYFLSHLPSQVNPWEVLWIILFSLLVTLLATWYPARKGGKLNPVRILQGGHD